MFKWSASSLSHLASVENRLLRVAYKALGYGEIDMSAICGHRNEREQNEAYKTRRSTKLWPQSEHNKCPSNALDIVPFISGDEWIEYVEDYYSSSEPEKDKLLTRKGGIPWRDEFYFYKLHAYMMKAAREEGVELTWGGFWHKPKDMPHYEIKED